MRVALPSLHVHVFVSTDSTTVAASETILVVARSAAIRSGHGRTGAAADAVPGGDDILARLRAEEAWRRTAIERALGSSVYERGFAVRGRSFRPWRRHEYAPIGTPPPPHASDSEPDLEAAGFADEISPQAQAVSTTQRIRAPEPLLPEPPPPEPLPPEPKSDAEERKEAHSNGIVSIKQAGFREIGGAVAAAAPMTAERMAAIAASMAD